MTDSRLASSFVQARLYRVNPGRPLRLIVIHDMEAPEGPSTAENCARFFAGPSAGGSAHYCVDTDSVVQCVKEADQAAHAPGANTDGIGIELNGYARQSRDEWLDDTSRQTMALAAALVRDVSARTGIPPRWLTDAEVADGQTKGITTHAVVSRVFKRSDHTDPGPDFPVDEFMALVAPAVAPIPTEDEDMPIMFVRGQNRGEVYRTNPDGTEPFLMRSEDQLKDTASLARENGVKVVGVPGQGGFVDQVGVPVRLVSDRLADELNKAAR